MLPLIGISHAVKTRRSDMGLTQKRVAELTGLSRQTVNQLETGLIQDLGVSKVVRLLEVLGLSLTVSAAHAKKSALRAGSAERTPASILAARTASTSYRNMLPPEVLKTALFDKVVPSQYEPHVRTLLEEAPISLLSDVVEELNSTGHLGRAQLWQNLRSLAEQIGCRRDIWQ